MIRVYVNNTYRNEQGATIDRGVKIETDAGFNPDALQDMTARALETWRAQRRIAMSDD